MWEVTPDIMKKKLRNHKNSARKRSIKCTLTLKQLTYAFNVNKGFCDFTQDIMTLTQEEGVCDESMVSIERVDEYGDYSLDNILLVSVGINRLKMRSLETKKPWNPKEGVSVETKKTIDAICKVVYNPIKLKEIQSKYLKFNEGVNMQEETANTAPESTSEALQQELTVSPDVYLSKGYFTLGELVCTVSNFDLSFAQYKAKMKKVKCGLTSTKFTENDTKVLFWVDKTKSFDYNNTIVTTKVVAGALDTFMASSKLNLTELKKLCKVIVNK